MVDGVKELETTRKWKFKGSKLYADSIVKKICSHQLSRTKRITRREKKLNNNIKIEIYL